MNTQQTKVWDIFIRVFHWSLVATFAIAYLTEDDFTTLHVYTGYSIITLIILRLIWGLVGTRHARFNDFVVSPKNVIRYLKNVIQFRAKRYIGHNPAGGAMVLALLASLSMTVLFGMLVYGSAEFSGPFSFLGDSVGNSMADAFGEVHEFFANFTLLLIFLHVVGVAVASLQHKENLVRSMFTGYKKTDNMINHNNETDTPRRCMK